MPALNSHCRRLIDIVAAAFLLAMLWPVIVLMACGLRMESVGNPFFIQTRVGRYGRPFQLIKMRTLYVDMFGIDLERELDEASPRITPLGRLLRRTKLDELPQLWNVLLGHMSLVGPRPDIPEQVARYTPEQAGRLRVRPGLTGAVQVCGNTAMDWGQRIGIDNWYIDHHSTWLDMKIIALTCLAIFDGERAIKNRLRLPPHLFSTVCQAQVSAFKESAECAT